MILAPVLLLLTAERAARAAGRLSACLSDFTTS